MAKSVSFIHGDGEFEITHPDADDPIIDRMRSEGGFLDSGLLESATTLIKPGNLVFDIGAALGDRTVFFAGVAKCRVIAFSADTDDLGAVRQNIDQNALGAFAQARRFAFDGGEFATTETPALISLNIGLEAAPELNSLLEASDPVLVWSSSSVGGYLEIADFVARRGYIPVGSVRGLFLKAAGDRAAQLSRVPPSDSGRVWLPVLEAGADDMVPLRRDELKKTLTAFEARFGELSAKVDGVMKAQLLLGATTESVQLEMRRRLTETLPRDLGATLGKVVAAELQNVTNSVADAVGVALGERSYLDLLNDGAAHRPLDAALSALGAQGNTPLALVDRDRLYGSAVPEPAPGELDVLNIRDDGWTKTGTALPGAKLEGRGVVRVADPGLEATGVVTTYIDCAAGGLLEVDVASHLIAGAAQRLRLRILSSDGETIGCDHPLEEGSSQARFFAPHRTGKLRICLLMEEPTADAALQVSALRVRRLSALAHQRRVAKTLPGPVIASLASIPSRKEMLADCIASLLVQCDRVRVFLNNYQETPAFLYHPRVEVRRSQDWDDRGDAGKFFWIDKNDGAEGYRLIVDDDLIFPPDFASTMVRKVAASGNRAIYAMHAVLLRQPFDHYYDASARAETFHFGHPVEVDRGAHIGATNAMCFHAGAVDMRWDDFKYCNSADVWLSLHAQKAGIPVLTPARPANWIAENRQATPSDTIYDHAIGRTKTRFDSSLVQDAALKHARPLTVQPLDRLKLGLLIEVGSPDTLRRTFATWLSVRDEAVEWALTLIYNPADEALSRAAITTSAPNEIHLVPGIGEDGRRAAAELQPKLGVEASFFLSATVELAPMGVGEAALLLHLAEGCALWRRGEGEPVQAISVARTEAALTALHAAMSTCRLVNGSGASAGPVDPAPFLRAFDQAPAQVRGQPRGPYRVNDVFQKVQVLSFSNRPDRWKTASARLARAGVTSERISLADPESRRIADAFAAYRSKAQAVVGHEVAEIADLTDFYLHAGSQSARLAYLEAKTGEKAIPTATTWSELCGYEALLETALSDQTEALLALGDDVALHKDFASLFDTAIRELPEDWLILQLGETPRVGDAPLRAPHTPMLCQLNGCVSGTHAIGMRFEIMPYLLDHTKRMDMPFDTGALSAAARAFPDRCFVISPDLAIQRQDAHETLNNRRPEDYDHGDRTESEAMLIPSGR